MQFLRLYLSLESPLIHVSLNYFTINTYYYLGCSLLLLSYIRYDSPPSVSNMTYRPLCDWTSWNKQLMSVSFMQFLHLYFSLESPLYMFPLTISPPTLIVILVAHYCSWATIDITVLHQYQTWHTDHSVTGLHEILTIDTGGKYAVLESIIFLDYFTINTNWYPCCSETTLDMTVLHQYQTWHTDHSVTGLHEINNRQWWQICSSCI